MNRLKENAFGLVALAVFALSLFLSYYPVVHWHITMPPGDDIYVHLRNITIISQDGYTPAAVSYPPGLYFVTIGIAFLTHISNQQALLALAPALLPLSGLAIFALAWRLYGKAAGVCAYVLYALVSLQPFQTYLDGSLPSIATAGIILPTLMLCLVNLIEGVRRARWAFLACILTVALFVFHHLTVLVAIATFLVWGTSVALVYIGMSRPRLARVVLGGLVSLGALVLLGYAFLTAEIFMPARAVFTQFVIIDGRFPFLHESQFVVQKGWTTFLFGLSVGGFVFQAGVLGALAAPWRRIYRFPQKASRLLVSSWLLVYLIGGLSSWTGEPTRLARDLAMPACIGAGWLVVEVWKWFTGRWRLMSMVWVLIVLTLCVPQAILKVRMETAYSSMYRFGVADQDAYAYLLESGMAAKTTVLTREENWRVVAGSREQVASFAAIVRETADKETYGPGDCVLVGAYSAGVWPPALGDLTFPDRYLADPEWVLERSFADSDKTWHLLCHR